MTDEPFVIASHVPDYDNPLEADLHNLELRLKLQQKWVQQTENEIAVIKQRIQESEGGVNDGV